MTRARDLKRRVDDIAPTFLPCEREAFDALRALRLPASQHGLRVALSVITAGLRLPFDEAAFRRALRDDVRFRVDDSLPDIDPQLASLLPVITAAIEPHVFD